MGDTPHVFNVTEADFDQLVIANSQTQPVFVDFWAAWCGPCQTLMPILEALAEEYQGKFVLAKINSDEQKNLAEQNGVRSLPTVKVFFKGKEVDSFTGVQPESVIRQIIEMHIERESDKIRDKGLAEIKNGDEEEGLELLHKAIEMDPSRDYLKLDLARGYVSVGNASKASETLETLPYDFRNSEKAGKIDAMINFINATQNAPSDTELEAWIIKQPDDLEARYQLGASKVLADNNEAALKHFLEIMQCDRKFRDDAGHKGILAIFKLLGAEHELVKQYRRKLAMLLH